MHEGLAEMRGYLDVDNRRTILGELEARAAQPDFWDDQNAAKEVIGKTNAQRAFVKPFDELTRLIEDGEVMLELAEAEDEGEQRQQALADLEQTLDRADVMMAKLRMQSLLGGKLDACNAYLTLHSGAGGTESCDWADMLFRMYRMYCEDNGFEVEVLDFQPGDEAGIKSVTFLVSGSYAYGYLKAERGVHRLVRISPFDANKRRHTSFVSLDVVAELSDEIEVEIRDEDLRIDTYRSGGAGGQHVNKTESAIRLLHKPTGMVIECQDERSQHKNRDKALKILKSRLYDMKQREQHEKIASERRSQVGTGDRSERIRTYNYPQGRITDHRIGYTIYSLDTFLDGDINELIDALIAADTAERLKSQEI